MEHLISLLDQHSFIFGIAGYWLFNAFVGGAPEPTEKSSVGDRWFYSSLHLFAGNIDKCINARYGAQLQIQQKS
jgi:hypothetical protein